MPRLDRKKVEEILYRPGSTIERLFAVVDTFIDGKSQCQGCGVCCHHNGEMTITDVEYGLLKDKPRVSDGENGACIFLNKDMTCSVYDVRPLECRLYNIVDDEIFTNSTRVEKQYAGNKMLAVREMAYMAMGFLSSTGDKMKVWFSG